MLANLMSLPFRVPDMRRGASVTGETLAPR